MGKTRSARPGSQKTFKFVTALPFLGVLLSGALSGGESATIRLITRDSFVSGIPLLVRVELCRGDDSLAREVWDAEAQLAATPPSAALSTQRVRLRNGLGSALVKVEAGGDIWLEATFGELSAGKEVRLLESSAAPLLRGDLPGGLVEWSGPVRITGDLRVPPGTLLRLLPGTLVLLDGIASGEDGSDVDVEGALESLGTEERPVTFTASDPSRPWGEIDHDGSEPSIYRYTHITRAGHSPPGGHTNTGPAVRPRRGASITFEHTTISDNAGKVMQARGADLRFRDSLFARSVMGPEIDNTQLVAERSYFLEMHGNDDNDGIYMHSQSAGQILSLLGCVVAVGDDDAIDTLGSEVTIEDTIIRDFADKGISVFHNRVDVKRCLIVDNDIGVSAKTSNNRLARVTVDRSTVVRNRLGIQARDKNGQPDAVIEYFVTSSIVRRTEEPGSFTVQTDYDPAEIRISYSNVADPWPGEGNFTGDPRFVAPLTHDYRLQADSPCINAGDPEASPDADGSRADCGAFPFSGTPEPPEPPFRRGRVNPDAFIDLSDAIGILLHLFRGGPLDCRDAGDTNDDGLVNITDAVDLLGYLFGGDRPPAPPFERCDEDPTADELGCEMDRCFD